jgi:hypothetical protein
MFAIDAAARRIVAGTAVQTLWSKAIGSCTFLVGLLAGAGLTLQMHQWSTSSLNLCLSSSVGLRQVNNTQPDPVLAFTLYPVTAPAGQIAVLAAAIAALVGFLLWSKQATSASFFWGVLAGIGFVLSFDIVWVHWIFGLHHLTNTQMDLVLEPLLVLLGLIFLWFAITRERRQANRATYQNSG